MRKLMGLVLLLSLAGLQVHAEGSKEVEQPVKQERKFGDTYRIDVVVNELEGTKNVDTNTYTMLVQSERTGKLNVVSREGALSLQCWLDEVKTGLTLTINLEVSTFESETQGKARKFSMQSSSAISLGKPTLITAADNVASDHSFQAEVTITKAK